MDLGLYLFFVLSGYLVMRPFVSGAIVGRVVLSYSTHLRRRLIRIVVPFWAAFACIAVRHAVLANPADIDVWTGASTKSMVAIPLFLQDWFPAPFTHLVGQAWTLAVEINFYVLGPVLLLSLVALIRTKWSGWSELKRSVWIIAVAVSIGLGSVMTRAALPDDVAWQRSFPALAVVFVPGVVLASLEHQLIPHLRDRRRLVTQMSLILAGLAVFVLVPYHLLGGRAHDFEPSLPAARPLLASIAMGCLVGSLLVREWGGIAVLPWLRGGVIHWIGTRSYSLYLLHTAVIFEFTALASGAPLPLRFLVICVAALTATLGGTYLFHRFVEAPSLRLARRVGHGEPTGEGAEDHAAVAP